MATQQSTRFVVIPIEYAPGQWTFCVRDVRANVFVASDQHGSTRTWETHWEAEAQATLWNARYCADCGNFLGHRGVSVGKGEYLCVDCVPAEAKQPYQRDPRGAWEF